MADGKKRARKTTQISARIFADDLQELKRRAGTIPWTIYLREFLRENLRKKGGKIL